MRRREAGFTLVELIVTILIVAVLAWIGAANYAAMQKRAREASLKANMHTFQLAAEDFGLLNGAYSSRADSVAPLLPLGGADFRNPFTKRAGRDDAWCDQPAWRTPLSSGTTSAGIVAYGDSACVRYQIAGRGASSDLPLRYTSGD
jgi:prepilin-type N-terminal cleavage/methylation domain-containing protein